MSSTLQRSNETTPSKTPEWSNIFDEKPTRDEESKRSKPFRPLSLPLTATSTPIILPALVKKNTAASSSLYGRISSLSSHLVAASSKNSVSSMSSDTTPQPTERGDPDGDCGASESTVNFGNDSEQGSGCLSSDEIISVRKGWLLKQDPRTKEWSRYWFSQKGAALFYYRDPVAEERGVLDGVLDVNNITSISEIAVPKSFGFQLLTWDNRRFILSAATSGARCNWINVIKCAAGLPPSKITYDLCSEQKKTDDLKPKLKDKTRSFILSSDDEYRTASEGGKRDSIDLGSSPLSPSPPIVSFTKKTKERLRRVSRGKLKRHDTVDSVASDELPATVREETELQTKIADAEKEIKILRADAQDREAKMSELLLTLRRTEFELSTRKREAEDVRESISVKLEEATRNAQQVIKRLTAELENSRDIIKDLEDQLGGIAENEALYNQLQQMSPAPSLSDLGRSKMKRMDSFSDLASLSDIDPYCLDKEVLIEEYTDLKSRFEKAISELKIMKKELKEAHNMYDMMELQYSSLKMQLEQQKAEEQNQSQMFSARIQDLTSKYSASEKNIRNLKQKLLRTEKRRTLSLKGREVLTLQKDLEEKVSELESKVEAIAPITPLPLPPTKEETRKRLRRKSLDSTSSSSSSSVQMVIRLNAIEKRIEGITKSPKESAWEDQNDTRLNYLETIVATSQEIIKCNLKYLHNIKSKLRISTDTKEVLRHLEKSLNESLKILTISSDEDQVAKYSGFEVIRSILLQIENQIRAKLNDLLVQRRLLKESNKLTYEKDLELLAERIAFESVSFGRLRNAMNFGEGEAKAPRTEVIETIQLIASLKNKLSGKNSQGNTLRNSTDVLVTVLARRLILTASKLKNPVPNGPVVSSEILEDLLTQQTEISATIKQYKATTLEILAYQLASETFDAPNNEIVHSTVHGIWQQANESVNFELIQAEIAGLMVCNAQKLKSFESVTGYTLNVREKLTFENIADEAQNALQKEMEMCIEELAEFYHDGLEKLKRDQWRLHLEQERKICDSRQILADFADITAHKALIDARIAVLSGKVTASEPPRDSPRNTAQIQKYEDLFCNLCQDLEIAYPEDILADADFNLMYRYFTTEFLMNNLELKDLCTALNKLEKAINSMLHLVDPSSSLLQSLGYEAQNFEDICTKCEELETVVNTIIYSVNALKTTSENYKVLQENYARLATKHQEEICEIKDIHQEKINRLMEQINSHKQALVAFKVEKDEMLSQREADKKVLVQLEEDLQKMTEKVQDYRIRRHESELEKMELLQKLENDNKKLFNYRDRFDELCINYSKQCEQLASLKKERNEIFDQFEKEQRRCNKIEKHLARLQDEFNFEVERLQAFSKQKPMQMDSTSEGDSLSKRYQAEIEQLRVRKAPNS